MSTNIKVKEKKPRAFLGKTSGFINSGERNFEKAHLKAYLKGQRYFFHGFNSFVTGREPKRHRVLTINQ